MVLVKKDNQPSCKWPLGRIKNIIKGQDGLVRVVDVQTATKIIRRPITKLAPIPVQDSPEQTIEDKDINSQNESTHNPKRAKLSNSVMETAKIISKIKQNEDHLVNTLKIMKTDRAEIEKEFTKIERVLSSHNNKIEKLNDAIQQENTATNFIHLALQIVLVLTYLQRVQVSLLDVLTDSHHGQINPELPSPTQLKTELYRIKVSLPNSLKLPESTDLLKFYSIITIESRLVEQLLIVNLKLPLVSSDEFEIINITPVPWVSNHTFKQISTKFNFLIVNLHRDQYYPLVETTLKSCTHMEPEK